jgi:Tfp pilus assembly protein PilF
MEAARTRLRLALAHRQRGDAAAAADALEAAARVLEPAGATAEVAVVRAALAGDVGR